MGRRRFGDRALPAPTRQRIGHASGIPFAGFGSHAAQLRSPPTAPPTGRRNHSSSISRARRERSTTLSIRSSSIFTDGVASSFMQIALTSGSTIG